MSDSFSLSFFSFSYLFGLFGARFSIIIQTFSAMSLLCLVHTQGSPDSFALFALLGVHVSAFLLSFTSFSSHSAGSAFCSVQHFSFSFLLSHHCLCFYTLCSLSFFLLCYSTSSSPLSHYSLSLFVLFCFFTYDQLHYHRSTIQTSTPLFTARYHVCYCFSAFGIDIDRKKVLHLLLIPRFIFCD